MMMKCKEYIFKLTSGQLEDAKLMTRMQASQHRLMCRRCRAFTRNNTQLDQILADYQEHVAKPDTDQS